MFHRFIDPWHVIDKRKIVHGCSTFKRTIIVLATCIPLVAQLNWIEATVQ